MRTQNYHLSPPRTQYLFLPLTVHCLLFTIIVLWSCGASARSSLLFLEAQGIAGYDSIRHEPVYYSMQRNDAMQKPSVGFDYLQRLSGATGDWGAFALQMRLAYNDDHQSINEHPLSVQVYNAFFKYKTRAADMWIGHNRIAFGMGSYLDSHSLLLQPLTMQGFGYDRDWGIGAARDFAWGSLAFSCSTGTGMPFSLNGNYLFSSRISYGVPARDNYTIGFSAAYGEPLETIGYTKIVSHPQHTVLSGIDGAYFWNNFEARIEAVAGENHSKDSYGFLCRIGVHFFDEERLKFEAQPVYWKKGQERSYEASAGVSWKYNADVTLRSMYTYDGQMNGNRIIFQIYWYYNLF